MLVEVPDLVAEWLRHPQYGVNALLPSVPRNGLDREPPPLRCVLAETRSGDVARGTFPNDPLAYPLLAVWIPREVAISTTVRQGKWDVPSLPVRIAYAVRAVDSERGLTDAGYTIRAILRSLWAFEDGSNTTAVAARRRNSITIQGLSDRDGDLSLMPASAPLPDVYVLGGLTVGLRVVDTAPGG